MSRRIGIAGATGALGREIVSTLDQAPWRPDTIVPMARASSEVTHVEYGGSDVAVDDLAHLVVDELDALIVALPRAAAAPVVDAAAQAGVPVVDCSASALHDMGVPLVISWWDAPIPSDRARDAVAIPSAAGLLVASVLGPLARAGFRGRADATVMLPASAWGRDGIEELSKQVVALFNAAPPPRKVFTRGLAFDLEPEVGTAASTGWTEDELRAMAEVGRLTGLRTAITLVGAPLFTGASAVLRLEGPGLPEALAATRALEGEGIGAPDRTPRPRRMDGHRLPAVGRIRSAPDGSGLHIWAAMDNLQAAATAAVGACGRLLGETDGGAVH